MTLHDRIISFLNSHDLISVNGLEKKLYIYPNTIHQAKKGLRPIPEKYLDKIAIFLISYGFDAKEYISESKNSTLEFSKKNVRLDVNNDDEIIITITNPNCEIYDIFSDLEKRLRGF